MEDNTRYKSIKEWLNKFSYYLVTFFMSVIIGLGLSIILDLPLKFLRVVNIDLGHFIVQFLGMCIALYIRSYSRAYYANTHTYTFSLKTALISVGLVFVVQILLVLILGVKNGGHAVYIAGPSRWLSTYVLELIKPIGEVRYATYCQLNWSLMLLLDILVYAPIMVLSEYWGDKKNCKESA